MAKVDRILFNSLKMKNVSENVQSFIKEQEFLILDFKQIFSDLANCYKTGNSEKIYDLNDIMIDNMNKIKTNFQNDVILFEKVDTKYKETNEEVDNMFRNIKNVEK